MIFTGEQVLNATIATNALSQQPLRVKASIKVRRTKRALDAEADIIEAERQAILSRHAAKNDDGTMKLLDDGRTAEIVDRVAFQAEIDELFGKDFDITIEPVTVTEIENIELSPMLLDLLLELGLVEE